MSTLFDRMEDGQLAESQCEEAISTVLGVDLLGISFDTYDASFEIYPGEDVADVAPTQEQHDRILALGCTRYWINFPDDTQRYGTGPRVSANGQNRWKAHNRYRETRRSIAEDRLAVLQLLYEAHRREPCGPTLEAISAAIQHLQAIDAGAQEEHRGN